MLAVPLPGPQTTADVERAVEAVFSQPAFREGLERSHVETLPWWVLIVRKLLEWYDDILGFFERLQVDSPVLYWLTLAALVLLAVLLLAHIGRTFVRALRGGVLEPEDDEDGGLAAGRARHFRELRAEARRLAAAGSAREAIRMLLLALLALLEERRVLAVAAGWTNREILARLDLGGELVPQLRRFGAMVEGACYGGAPVGHVEFEQVDGLLERLGPSLTRRGGASRDDADETS